MHTTAQDATALAVRALTSAGVPSEAAALQADLLVDSEMRGLPSHGLLRLPRLVERIHNGVANPAETGVHRWIADALLDVDGRDGLGPVVATAALDKISERAHSAGIACAEIRASNHLGALAWYVRRVAAAGQVVVALTTSEAIMHPFGGTQALVGSNPIAIGVPVDDQRPLVFDMATTLVSMGKVHDYANRGRDLPPGWALNEAGEPTQDAASAKTGALAPFGGAKGYGLAIAFEALVVALTGTHLGREVAGTLDSVSRPTKGDVFIVAEPRSGTGQAIAAYLDEVRRSRPSTPGIPVAVPGDRSDSRRLHSEQHGFEVPDGVWTQIADLAASPHASAAAPAPSPTSADRSRAQGDSQ
ncbi:Ldh family oxidoreductase [Streptomyces sp. RS2]|uniref:Ldh family oxidoreductase n=1 Tax=Streptomyces sp. RS2 TaxID=1451205 RepID=UPI0021F8A91B|nr:Ldh family oxidoreductase [Streptomyces sp. RS2]MCW1100123.1 Ldh family oxidoreductase [Streptomyces sp. RS2]